MKKVLVVEDDEQLRNVCKIALTKQNLKVYTARDSHEALRVLNDSFDIVLSDFNMPGFNGLWLAAQIKRKYPEVPVIIMTGNTNIAELEKISRSGVVCDIIKKPFIISDIVITISRHLK